MTLTQRTRDLFLWCLDNEISVTAVLIAGTDTLITDQLSRPRHGPLPRAWGPPQAGARPCPGAQPQTDICLWPGLCITQWRPTSLLLGDPGDRFVCHMDVQDGRALRQPTSPYTGSTVYGLQHPVAHGTDVPVSSSLSYSDMSVHQISREAAVVFIIQYCPCRG
jgi:hypothetical protein